jgi:phosphoribosylaminoimidazolecarboxamide formyltransferase/IMP cyclohydrolase
MNKKIKSALISVFYKDNLEPIVKKLGELGVTIFSTGGTRDFIEKCGIKVTAVEELTAYPSILGGRVKTLHPKIFGGILSRRENNKDLEQLDEYQIPEIDLVIVGLYPFEETLAKFSQTAELNEEEIIEKIDIGGVSLIRAAAKNFNDVVIIPSRSEYPYLLKILEEKKGISSIEDRRFLASRAFTITSKYDMAILKYFENGTEPPMPVTPKTNSNTHKIKKLRYGENPHQQGYFYGDFEKMFTQLNGKELSYNNLLDIDAAANLIAEFPPPPSLSKGESVARSSSPPSGELDGRTFAILKHNNACGLASRNKLIDAWNAALAADPVSAFGGILITNAKVDEETAVEINKLFFEVIIAPDYDENALNILMKKQNRIILRQKQIQLPEKLVRSALNGYLEQDRDFKTETEKDLRPVTKVLPTKEELSDLIFANKIVKHSKSNAIVLAKNKQLLASGIGQTSRVDALKQAIMKAKNFGLDLNGAVMASDAFFPFPDCVEIAHQAGIIAVVQPGGSIRDKDSVEFCDKHNISMVFTGIRHFKH